MSHPIEIANDIKAAIAELADGRSYPDLLEAVDSLAALAHTGQAAPAGEVASIEALAHRMAWRYKKSSDPHHSDTYTFNRTTLIDFARKLATPATEPAAPGYVSDETKVWEEFFAALERIRPIGQRHAGMLKAVKKYRLLGK